MDKPEGRHTSIPGDVTLLELIQNMPISIAWKFVGLLFVAFSLGLGIGERDTLSKWLHLNASTSETGSPTLILENAANSIAAIREQDHVALIDSLQNEQTSDRIAAGQYGFVYSIDIESYVSERQALSIYHESDFLKFELHKIANQQLVLVAYAGTADISALRDPTRSRRDFELFSSRQDGTMPITIDLDSIESWRARTLPDTAGIVAEVRLKPL